MVGWLKVLAAGAAAVQRGYSQHYRGPFETVRDRPGELMGNPAYLAPPVNPGIMAEAPLDYRGDPLRYTEPADPVSRAVRNAI